MERVNEPASVLSWRSLPHRTEANRRDVERLRIPPETVVSFGAIDWFNSVKEFRDIEAEHIKDTQSDEHRAGISQLIAQGESLAIAAKRYGLTEGVEFRPEDIAAAVGLLRETLREIHGPHNHPATDRRILEILNEP